MNAQSLIHARTTEHASTMSDPINVSAPMAGRVRTANMVRLNYIYFRGSDNVVVN